MPSGKMNPILALSDQHGVMQSAEPGEVDRMVRRNQSRPTGPAPSGSGASEITPEIKRLMDEFPDAKTALLAASWGEDATRRWMENGADPSEIPEEDMRFVQDMLPKVQEGMDKPVESTTVSQTPERKARESAEKARRMAREDILASTLAGGMQGRESARQAVRGAMQQMRGQSVERETNAPEVRREAPNQ